MTYLATLIAKSAWNRRLTVSLVLFAIALSVALLLGVERINNGAREGFSQTISGTDLVVGARTGAVQLLLYAIFNIGDATNNMRWSSYLAIADHPAVAWSVPLSLGDSHQSFRVVGTSPAYFEHMRYARGRSLEVAQGRSFQDIFEAVLGAEVTERLGYRLNDRITLSHGGGSGAAEHADKPFTIVGVLGRTGTPVDRSVLINLESLSAIHLEWQGGAPMPGLSIPAEYVRKFDLAPKEITAALVGLKSRAEVFRIQRFVNDYRGEPLLAVLPGVALQELWQVVAIVERALLAISILVVAVGLTGLVAVVLASLNERRRELAILRSVGARPLHVFLLLGGESLLISVLGCLAGVALLCGVIAAAGPALENRFGLTLDLVAPSSAELWLLAGVVAAALLASLIPAYRAYRYSLADGLTLRT